MASNRWKDVLRQAHSSRMKYTYTALVEIRKRFMKTPKDVGQLVNNGLVKRLLDLIRSRESIDEDYRSKVIDISLSILSNMCMEDITRKKVLKDKGTGVTIIVELFEELEIESLLNRACRCLSNMLLDPGSWTLVSTSSVIEKIVKLLRDTEKEEYQLTCIRALRLLGQTGSNVQKLVEQNAISVVMKLIDCDIDTVKQASLRCVHSLSGHGSTLQFASQAVASGKISYLLTLVKESNIQAFQLVIRFCEFHNFRAEFGNAGGINTFKEMFESGESFYEERREDILSVLCLCCKEAVNRVKLRDENILILFMQALSNAELTNLHVRIISAFVCFLYDETSFNILLENGLVPLLIKMLKDILNIETEENTVKADFKSEELTRAVVNEYKSEVSTDSETNIKQEIVSKCGEIENNQCDIPVASSSENEQDFEKGKRGNNLVETNNDMELVNETSAEILDEDVNEVNKTDERLKENDKCVIVGEDIGSESVVTEIQTGNDLTIDSKSSKRSRPVYSIDSPTYEPNIEWEYKDYEGAKCIEKFTPPHSVEYSHQNTYSPFSNSSYYSPVDSSSEYSPLSSPSTSPVNMKTSRNIFTGTSPDCHGYSPENSCTLQESLSLRIPKYTGVSGEPFSSLSSPESEQPECLYFVNSNLSPEATECHGNDINDSFGFGSQGFGDELSEDPLEGVCDEGSVDDTIIGKEITQEKINQTKSIASTHSNFDSIETDESSDKLLEENTEKLKALIQTEEQCKKKRKILRRGNNVTEFNILILLSRISQMNEPTKHLVTRNVLTCLLDYMSLMEASLARCPRLLSRIFRNPVCFSKVLTYQIPTIIFNKLLKYADLQGLTKYIRKKERKVKRKSTYGNAEISHEVETDLDRFSMSDDLLVKEEGASKRRKTSEDGNKKSYCLKGEYHNQEESICDVGKSGLAFLEDLSGLVDTNYGRGVLERLLYTVTSHQHTDLCINILYITWTQASRQYFFNEREVLDVVLHVFNLGDHFDSRQFVYVVNGIRLLSHIIDIKGRYHSVKTKHSFTKWKDHTTVGTVDCTGKRKTEPSDVKSSTMSYNIEMCNATCCMRDSDIVMDIVFIVDNEKIPANREIISKGSEIFAAMLQGHYSEATKSEIPISETSKFAMEFLVHHLHGCKRESCKNIAMLYDQTVDRSSAGQCIQLLEESSKYMLSDLCNIVIECLFSRYIIPESAFSVLQYAVIHRNENLLKAAVSCIFYNCVKIDQIIDLLYEVLSSNYKDIFLTTLREILTE